MLLAILLVFFSFQKGGNACLEERDQLIELDPGEKKVLSCCHFSSMADANWKKMISDDNSKKLNWCRKFSGTDPPPACVNYRSSLRIDLHLLVKAGDHPVTYLCGKTAYWNGKFVASAKITVKVKDDVATTPLPPTTALPTEYQISLPTNSSFDDNVTFIGVSDLPYNCSKRSVGSVILKVPKGYRSSSNQYFSKCISPVESGGKKITWTDSSFSYGILKGKRLSKCRLSKNTCFGQRTEWSVALKIINFDLAKNKTFVCVYKNDGEREKICQITVQVYTGHNG
eukprot:m.99799 g.99799  ORF g.99799 m.99799 type:complete len:284 (+) comp37073_c0_seq49:698-1549(+)